MQASNPQKIQPQRRLYSMLCLEELVVVHHSKISQIWPKWVSSSIICTWESSYILLLILLIIDWAVITSGVDYTLYPSHMSQRHYIAALTIHDIILMCYIQLVSSATFLYTLSHIPVSLQMGWDEIYGNYHCGGLCLINDTWNYIVRWTRW